MRNLWVVVLVALLLAMAGAAHADAATDALKATVESLQKQLTDALNRLKALEAAQTAAKPAVEPAERKPQWYDKVKLTGYWQARYEDRKNAVGNFPPGTCLIRPGDTVLVPAPWQTLPTATPLPTDLRPGTVVDYAAEPGASFMSIAQYFNSTVDRILLESNKYRIANGLKPWTVQSLLNIGDVVKVPVNIVTPTPTPTMTRTFTPTATR